MRGRAVAARRAHNPEVAGSSPAPATQLLETANIQNWWSLAIFWKFQKEKCLNFFL